MGLEDILKNIEKKVSTEIEKLTLEAEKEKKKIIDKATEEAQEKKKSLLKKFKKEAEDEKRKRLIKAKMEGKNEILALKQKFMTDAFQKAKQEFDNLDKREYLALFKESLLSTIDSGEEKILISPRDTSIVNEQFIREIENELRKMGKKGKLKFVPELDESERGFIIRKKGMQINRTLSTLFSELKDKIEIEIARRLFNPNSVIQN